MWTGISYALKGHPPGVVRRLALPNTWDYYGFWSTAAVGLLSYRCSYHVLHVHTCLLSEASGTNTLLGSALELGASDYSMALWLIIMCHAAGRSGPAGQHMQLPC